MARVPERVWMWALVGLRSRARRGAILALLLSAGCAPQSPADSAEKQSQGSESGASTEPQVAPLPPLDPVPAPEGVVARLRIRDPLKLSDGVLDAASIPFDLSKALERLDGEYAFVRAIDLSAAIEGAVVLNPQDPLNPSRFVSVGTKGVDDVLRVLEDEKIPVQEGPGGVFHFRLGRDPCAVGRAVGESPARMVCSDRRGGLHQVLPYALRGFPSEALSSADVYVQADLRPIRHRYKKELDRLRLLASVLARQGHTGHPKLDRALSDAAISAADELTRLANEAEQVVLEIREKGGNLKLEINAMFDGQASTTVQSIVAQAALSTPPPEQFGRLPSTTASGSFLRELPAESVQAWTSIIVDLATGYAENQGASLEFAERLSRVVKMLIPANGRTHIQARGPIVSTLIKGKPMARAAWSVWGVDQPKQEIVALLDDMAWLIASKDWQKLVESEELGGTLKRSNKRIKGAPGATVYKLSLSDSTKQKLEEQFDAPVGASVTEIVKTAKMLSSAYVAVFEIEDMTYVSWVMGDDLSAIDEAFSALSSKDVERLSDVTEYKKILSTPAVAGGFFTLLGIGSELWSFAPDQIVKDLPGLLNATPHRGLVPMSMSYRTSSGGKTKAEFVIEVPREFTQDAATLAAILFTEMNMD